jgi:hypothetical protein
MALFKIDPEKLPRFTNTIEMGGIRYQFVWRWNNRTLAWYVDVYDSEGTLLLAGERLSVNGRIGYGSTVFSFSLFPAGTDEHTSWELWSAGKMTLFLVE